MHFERSLALSSEPRRLERVSSNWRGIIADIERAATPKGRAKLGCFSIEGLRLHERAIRAGVQPKRTVVADSFLANSSERVIRLLKQIKSPLTAAPDDEIDRLTEGRSIGAIVSLVRLPKKPKTADLLDEGAVFLVALDVEDPGNVGALVRTALASGAKAFISVGISDPYHPKAVRTSMGSIFKLPIISYPAYGPLIEELRSTGTRMIGAVSTGGTPLPQLEPATKPTALFMGGEAFGLADAVSSQLDALVTIPMVSEVDSYSVNAAAAVLLYELVIRRKYL